MTATVELHALVDSGGQIVAAYAEDTTAASADRETPSGRFLPSDGQREITFAIPREALELPGPEFQRFLSQVKIRWPADVELPKVKVVKQARKR